MTDAELDAQPAALLTEEQALLKGHALLRLTPDDRHGHVAHHERLNPHKVRTRAFNRPCVSERQGRRERRHLPGLPVGVSHAAQARAAIWLGWQFPRVRWVAVIRIQRATCSTGQCSGAATLATGGFCPVRSSQPTPTLRSGRQPDSPIQTTTGASGGWRLVAACEPVELPQGDDPSVDSLQLGTHTTVHVGSRAFKLIWSG